MNKSFYIACSFYDAFWGHFLYFYSSSSVCIEISLLKKMFIDCLHCCSGVNIQFSHLNCMSECLDLRSDWLRGCFDILSRCLNICVYTKSVLLCRPFFVYVTPKL